MLSLSGELLAADRGGWCCLATVSAVWDYIEGRYHETTRLAADCVGFLRFAGLLRCDTSSEDSASNYFDLLTQRWRHVRGWSNEAKSTCGGSLAV